MSEALGHSVSMRITTRGLRTIEFHGGLDSYMQKAKKSKLAPELRKLKKAIESRVAAKSDSKAAA
jgi:large subunit ribosomal protein L28